MKNRNSRLDAIKVIIATQEICSQEELQQELQKEGYSMTQATLSRDLKQLKVAKAASLTGKYFYVLPNNTLYKRVTDTQQIQPNQPIYNGFKSLQFSNNIAIIRTRPGYASSIAYDIDNAQLREIIGTIAGDDTIMMIMSEGTTRTEVVRSLRSVIPNIQD